MSRAWHAACESCAEGAMQSNEEMTDAVALEIEHHLAHYPNASDTAEGIRAFWLRSELRAVPLELVINALDKLEADGVVQKVSLGLGFVYRAASGTVH
jgi:hypothetical protein